MPIPSSLFFAALLTAGVSALAAPQKPVFEPLPTSAAELALGEKLFRNHCGLCHGPKGEGSRGPTLARAQLGRAPDDAALIDVLSSGIRGTEMRGADNIMTDHEIRLTAAYVRSLGRIEPKPVPGDSPRGAVIYRVKGCAGCHSLRGEGGVVGPDLAGIGERRSADHIRESLLNPEADLPEGYLMVTATPKNGSAVNGSRVNEDSFSIQIRDNSGGWHSFWKADLAKLEKLRGKSAMPSYRARLTDSELTDLIAYLASLKGSR